MRSRYDRREPKIYRRENGKWRVRFFDPEANAYREKTVATKTEAQNFKRALVCGDSVEKWLPSKTDIEGYKHLTFSDLAEKYLDHGRHVRRISESCLKNYETHLKLHILPVFGNKRAELIGIDDIEKLARVINTKIPQTRSYQAIRKARLDIENLGGTEVLSLSYQREVLTVACMITRWASSRRPALLTVNPFEGFKLPATPEHLYEYWRTEDEDLFFDWLDNGGFYEIETTRYHHRGRPKSVVRLQIRNRDELRDIVMFALRTGMRLGEIGALRNMDVDLKNGFIIVRGSFSRKEGIRKNTTKNKKARRIEINDDVREILHNRRFRPERDPLFNTHMNSIKFFSRTCRQAGVREIHFHSLRHTCLTNLANGYGMDKALPLPKVQQIAGHNDIKTTMRYVHGDIITDTASRQWSREERLRRAKKDTVESPKERAEFRSEDVREAISPSSIPMGLRLVHSEN